MNTHAPAALRAALRDRCAAVIAAALSALPPIRDAQVARGAAELRARLAWAMFEARGGAR